MLKIISRALLAVFLLFQTGAVFAHPLDPLSWEEHLQVIDILKDNGQFQKKMQFSRIALQAPKKSRVWAWKKGDVLPRKAQVIARLGLRSFEGVVDISHKKVDIWQEIDGNAPWVFSEYFSPVVKTVMASSEFKQAMLNRGIAKPEEVSCRVVGPPGYLKAKYRGRRVGMVYCDYPQSMSNKYSHMIEGLEMYVDVVSREILEITEHGAIDVPTTNADYDLESVGSLREFEQAFEIHQPKGAGFQIDGHIITWDRWRFHLRSDQRVGLIISTLTWQDEERQRQIMYEGHLSEIYVPYMSPAPGWYTRTPLDAGEYNAGGLSDSMTKGVHCPEHASFINAIVSREDGAPHKKSAVACIFERVSGDINWLHDDQGRPKRELVVRMSARLGNYDYLIDWSFQTDGQMRVAMGATGIVAAAMVQAKNASTQDADNPDDRYGRFVDEHIVAINHDHYFNFRLDLDIDGQENVFRMDKLVEMPISDAHPRKGIWGIQSRDAVSESEAKMRLNIDQPLMWRVANSKAKNSLGYSTSYALMPGMTAHPLFSKDDPTRKRAGFINYDLWVTPYAPKERWAAGAYPTLGKPGMGLPAWTKANRDLRNTDIVAWYTMSMHHVVRAEDWPVMPVLWHHLDIKPFDFFDRNQSIESGLKP